MYKSVHAILQAAVSLQLSYFLISNTRNGDNEHLTCSKLPSKELG